MRLIGGREVLRLDREQPWRTFILAIATGLWTLSSVGSLRPTAMAQVLTNNAVVAASVRRIDGLLVASPLDRRAIAVAVEQLAKLVLPAPLPTSQHKTQLPPPLTTARPAQKGFDPEEQMRKTLGTGLPTEPNAATRDFGVGLEQFRTHITAGASREALAAEWQKLKAGAPR